MRVAMICPYSFTEPGGVQNHVLGLGGWMSTHGHEVAILGPGAADPARLAAHGLSSGQLTSLGRSLPVPYNGSVARITFGPRTHRRVGAWLRRVRPDVIHVHEPITPSASVHALWQANAPVVATFHTATPGSRTMRLAGRTMAGTIAAIDAGIAVSAVAREVARQHIGVEAQVIGNGITLADHPERTGGQGWRGGDRARITFIGRYDEPRKGFAVFTRAIELVRRRHPLVDVVVAGSGSRRSVPGVRFVGRLSDHERNQLLATSDVYVAPHTGRESFGIVLLEALASGTPVVASSLPAFREVLEGGEGPLGRVVEVGDPQALATGILASLGDLDHDPGPGRARAEEFDWSRIAPRIERVFHSVLSG
ncbi:glycosyltransferase family 4 protein [Aestuariimicrobium soli]|uniref:glycosyltransferase family 4 protein n=1 Tax=Aestuariimicrobium soli TaxID=2035834 RepID=UPI003EBAA542